MCRVLAYLGRPVALEHVLYETDSSLVRQVYEPRMMPQFLNLGGFGVAAWDERLNHPDEPFTYRVTELPTFDRNLRQLARKLAPSCVLAHVRGVTWDADVMVSTQNLHPFRFAGVPLAFAHNGHLREFAAMRYDLIAHIHPEFWRQIHGTTDSEWIYALLVSHLDAPHERPGTTEIVAATRRTLGVLREVRRRHGIDTSSPLNLFLATGDCLVATRFSFDYGWYPSDDTLLETDLPYVSLWYTLGEEYVQRDGRWLMIGGHARPQSLILASEPLTTDVSTWLEAPEYSLLTATRCEDGLAVETLELDA